MDRVHGVSIGATVKRCIRRVNEVQYDDSRHYTANRQTHPQTQGIAPGRRDNMPSPANGSLTVAKIAADIRPSADGSPVRTSLVAGGD